MALNRRNFLKQGSIVGLTLTSLPFSSCQSGKSEQTAKITSPSVTNASDFVLNECTIADLQKFMAEGKHTAHSITQLYLDRIRAIDHNGPKIRSVIEINPDALRIADQLDQERKAGKLRGPLHGIPVLIKDNIDTADQMLTTAGSLALEGNRATKDAFIVQRLRESGAVVLGKTNLSEWANFRSSRSSSGWSSRGGQTRNPYVLDRNPCGSSSGSGAAAAANLCAVTVGTETDGSVVCPASINGVVGIKPTVGLLSRSGIIPISHSQDTAGPMARTVRDAALLLGVLAGIDPADSVTKESQGKAHPDYTTFLDANGLQGKRIGVEKSFLEGQAGVTSLLQKALEQIKSKGATIVEVDIVKPFRELGDDEFTVLQYEFKDGLNRYLAGAHGKVKSLAELIKFNQANEAKMMPYFKQEILESSQLKGDLQSPEYQKALQHTRATSRRVIDGLLKEHQLSALCGPTYGPSWCTDLVNGDYFTGYGLSTPAAVSGYPHITVPLGLVQGLPVGLSFFGTAYSEPDLIRLAYAYEQVSHNRVPPSFLPTAVVS